MKKLLILTCVSLAFALIAMSPRACAELITWANIVDPWGVDHTSFGNPTTYDSDDFNITDPDTQPNPFVPGGEHEIEQAWIDLYCDVPDPPIEETFVAVHIGTGPNMQVYTVTLQPGYSGVLDIPLNETWTDYVDANGNLAQVEILVSGENQELIIDATSMHAQTPEPTTIFIASVIAGAVGIKRRFLK